MDKRFIFLVFLTGWRESITQLCSFNTKSTMAREKVDSDLTAYISLSELNEIDVKSFTGHEDDVRSS